MLRPVPTRLTIKEGDLLELQEARKRREAALKHDSRIPAQSTTTPPVRSVAERIGLAPRGDGGH